MRYLSLSLLLLLTIPFIAPAFGADWYDPNWLKARKITIDQTDIDTADLINYPLYVNMTLVNVGTDSQADCDDFVFTDSTNVTKLDHEIETCDDANNWAEFWVEVPTVSNTVDTDIFMYYDNAGATDQQNTQGTWNANYKAVWHLNGTFIDSTTSPITCTNSGTSAVTDEYVGGSRDWDGVDDYIDCGSDAKIDDIFNGGGSVSYWFNPDALGETTTPRIIVKSNVSPQNGWNVLNFDISGSDMDHRFVMLPTTGGDWITTAREIQLNTWNFITITYNDDATTNDPIIYVDGVSVGITETTSPTTAYVSDASDVLCIGNTGTGLACATTTTMDGTLDEPRMVDEILTAEWIKADWECQRGAVDGNSCITVGAEGEEPAAGGSHSQSYTDTLAITDTLVFTGTGEQVYSDTLAITDTLVFTGEGSQAYADTLAITDDLVFIYNDLNPDFTETLDLTDTYTQLCTGTCGVTPPTPTPNAIILSVNKSPFIFGVYSDATRMTCEISISGGVIWNSDDLNLNICNSTQWILPDGTGT
jgi:hypothetical protein